MMPVKADLALPLVCLDSAGVWLSCQAIICRGGSRDFKGGVHNLLLIQVSFFQWFFKPHIVKQIK